MSIRLKLILSICIPLLICYVLVLGWDYFHSRQQAIEQSERRVAERAASTAAQLNERMMSVQQVVDSAASVLTNRPLVNEAPRGLMQSAMRPGAWLSRFWIAFNPNVQRPESMSPVASMRRGPGGRPVMENLQSLDQTKLEDSPWFTRTRDADKGMWFDPVSIGSEGAKVCIYAAPFKTNGNFAGVVCASVAVDDLQHLRGDRARRFRGGGPGGGGGGGPPADLGSQTITPPSPQIQGSGLQRLEGRGPSAAPGAAPSATTQPLTDPVAMPVTAVGDGGYLLIDSSGNLISRPDGGVVPAVLTRMESSSPEFARAAREVLAGDHKIVVTDKLADLGAGFLPGEEYVLALEPIPTTGWMFVTAMRQSELLQPIRERLWQRAAFLIGSMLVLAIIVTIVSSRFCRPIEKLATRVRDISGGDLDVPPLPVRSHDEVGQLAAGFNTMTTQLRGHIAALTEQSAAREKVESELRIARQIQNDLLPRTFPPFPERSDFDLHAVNIPARHIAGDFFDFFFATPEVLTLVIADVAGKGVPAALLMAVTRTIVRNLAGAGMAPGAIIDKANQMLVEDSEPGRFVTMFIGQYRPATGELTYVNAGHPPPVLLGARGEAGFCCPPTGPIVGVTGDGEMGPFEEAKLVLGPGEGLLLYTDGVTESRGVTEELFGEARLLNAVRSRGGEAPGARGVATLAVDAAMQHQQGLAVDDVTVLVLRRAV